MKCFLILKMCSLSMTVQLEMASKPPIFNIFLIAEEIATIYELAVAKNPANEEFLSHLFMAYVRIGNNFKQQKVFNIGFMLNYYLCNFF